MAAVREARKLHGLSSRDLMEKSLFFDPRLSKREFYKERRRLWREVRNLTILKEAFPNAYFYPKLDSPLPHLKQERVSGMDLALSPFGEDDIRGSVVSFVEHRLPGRHLEEVVKKIEILDLIDIMLNVGRILHMVYQRVGLVFGDLHGWNILVHEKRRQRKIFIIDWESAAFAHKEIFGADIFREIKHPELVYFGNVSELKHHSTRLGGATDEQPNRLRFVFQTEPYSSPLASPAQDIHALTMHFARYFGEEEIAVATFRFLPSHFKSAEDYRRAIRNFIEDRLEIRREEFETERSRGLLKPRDLAELRMIPFLLKYLAQPYNSEVYSWELWLGDLEGIIKDLRRGLRFYRIRRASCRIFASIESRRRR